MSALPPAASANITPPTLRARTPNHLESQAIKIGKRPARPSPARKAPPNNPRRERAERNINSPVAASRSPPTATVTSFHRRRIAATVPRPLSSPAKKNMGASEIGRAHVELQSLRHLVCRLLLE